MQALWMAYKETQNATNTLGCLPMHICGVSVYETLLISFELLTSIPVG